MFSATRKQSTERASVAVKINGTEYSLRAGGTVLILPGRCLIDAVSCYPHGQDRSAQRKAGPGQWRSAGPGLSPVPALESRTRAEEAGWPSCLGPVRGVRAQGRARRREQAVVRSILPGTAPRFLALCRLEQTSFF